MAGAQLGETLEATTTVIEPDNGAAQAQLTRTRATLRDHACELHKEHRPWGISVFGAQMRLLELGQPQVAARVRGEDLINLSEERFAELLDALRDLVSLKGLSLEANGSPWSAAQVESQGDVADILALLDRLDSNVSEVHRRLTSGAQESGLMEPRGLKESEMLLDLWGQAESVAASFTPVIFEMDLNALVESARALDGSALQRLLASIASSDYRSARGRIRDSLAKGIQLDPKGLFTGLVAASELQEVWRSRCVAGPTTPSVPLDVAALRDVLVSIRADLERLSAIVNRELTSVEFAEVAAAVTALQAESETLGALPRTHRARSFFAKAGLAGFLAELEANQEMLATAELELDRLRWRSIVDHLMLSPTIAPSLASFRGERHEQTITAFRELDRTHVRTSAQRVRRIAAEAAVRAQDHHPEEADLVRAQAKRKRGHLPVRQLFSRAPNVVTALRPCWVMSPLMVPQAVPSDKANFDIVIFDEASQVRPVDAISSLIRGRQLVVAGDEHQLPPTTFFDQAPLADEADTEDEEDKSEIGDYESLLDVLMTLFDAEMLRWHYRSRDERLIGFSNKEIYGGSLTTFPGVVEGEVLHHVLVSDLPGEDELRVSPEAEVKQVVELVLKHAHTRPGESLGVIALGTAHAEAIDAGLLARLPEFPELEDFFSEGREERFFVKNLERVQGDERDAIILAIGYGRTPEGALPHRFGPLNNAGGERRLNVAVTRAKRRMTVVSSFSADEIDLARSSALGVRLLKAFLGYAASGGSVGVEEKVDDETALHRMLAEALSAGGFETRSALGYSTDRIDVVVIDPSTGRPAVAIEIDGKAYAARPSVRDRDRLRSEQLERLDWKHFMVWSMDWYRDPAAAARQAVSQVAARLGDPVQDAPGGPIVGGSPSSVSVSEGSGSAGGPRERPPRPTFGSGGSSITDWRLQDLVALAQWIQSDGLLRTSDELQREVMAELGITRRGARVARVLDEVVAALRRSG